MRRPLIALTITLALAACSAPAESDAGPTAADTDPTTTAEPTTTEPEPEPEPSTTTEEPEPTEPETGPHGYLLKEVGEDAGTAHPTDPDIWPVRFTVDQIVPGFECDYERPDPPANGQFIGIQITATTHASWTEVAGFDFEATMHDMVAFVDDTKVNDVSGNAALCLAEGSMFPRLGSGQNGTGWVVIDVPTDVTSVAFVPIWMDGAGWEWLVP